MTQSHFPVTLCVDLITGLLSQHTKYKSLQSHVSAMDLEGSPPGSSLPGPSTNSVCISI